MEDGSGAKTMTSRYEEKRMKIMKKGGTTGLLVLLFMIFFWKRGENMEKKYSIFTAIAYTSAKPHIGNTYEIVLADAIARFKRFQGFQVYFQTGTDEHGEKIALNASNNGITPQEYCDNISQEIKNIWDLMNTSYDKFVRTTDKRHEEIVGRIFQKLYEQGDIYLSKYEGLYCIPCESFFTESQLVDGKCPDCGREVVIKSEDAYFFKMSKYQKKLEDYIESHPDFIEPESRKNEIINNFIRPGLFDLCVSRTSFDWGVKVPMNEKHVVYVWLDALTNYITNVGYDVAAPSNEFYQIWPADLHVVGKDIIRFHMIYWPIFLMALNLPLPKKIYGHPWLLMNNDKMSKSKGNVLYADDLVKQYGVDAIRYYLLHEIPYNHDGNITLSLIEERINSDLANVLGNLVNRTITMGQKYFQGHIQNPNQIEEIDHLFLAKINDLDQQVILHMDKLEIGNAIDDIFDLLRASNKYIDETMPWILAKDEEKQDRLETVLYHLLESIRVSAIYLSSFLPETGQKILCQLNQKNDSRSFESTLKYELNQPEILFQRIDLSKDR